MKNSTAKILSGVIVGFGLGVLLKSTLIGSLGTNVVVSLMSGPGLLLVCSIVILAIFVSITIYATYSKIKDRKTTRYKNLIGKDIAMGI